MGLIAKEDAAAGMPGGDNLILTKKVPEKNDDSTNEDSSNFSLFEWINKILNYIKAWTTGLIATFLIIIPTLAIHLVITSFFMAMKTFKKMIATVKKSPILIVSILATLCALGTLLIVVAMMSVPILLLCSPLLLVAAFFSPVLIVIGIPILIAVLAFAFVTFSSTVVIAAVALGVLGVVFGVLGLPCDWPRLLYSTIVALYDKGCSEAGADPVGNFVINSISTVWRYLIPPLPAVSANLSGITALPFREPCEYSAPDRIMSESAEDRYNGEVWIYINGIATTKDIAETNRDLLFKMFGRPIHLVHNPTDSLLVDLIECLSFKAGLLNTLTFLQSLVHKKPRDVLKRTLKKFLNDDSVTKVVLFAHSQGTIVTGNALTDLLQEDVHEKMGIKLEVYNFANCAHGMPGAPDVKYIENISNGGDIVAWLGHLFVKAFKPFHSLWIDSDGNSLDISGKSVIEWSSWGHLLNTHYLLPMKNSDKYTGEVNGPSNENDNRSKLIQYMKENERVTSPSSCTIATKQKTT